MKKIIAIIFVLMSTVNVFGQSNTAELIAKRDSLRAVMEADARATAKRLEAREAMENTTVKIGDYVFKGGCLGINNRYENAKVTSDGKYAEWEYLCHNSDYDESKLLYNFIKENRENIYTKLGIHISDVWINGSYIAEVKITVVFDDVMAQYEAEQKAKKDAENAAAKARLNSLTNLLD